MIHVFKLLVALLLLVSASLSATAGVATGFIYPVGDPNTAPGYGNAYHVAQNFNTSYIYGGSSASPDGGWCNGSNPNVTYTSKASCEAKGFKWFYGHTGVDLSNYSCGGEIHAIADGVVEPSGSLAGYGFLLKLKHTLPSGKFVYSLYGHRQNPATTFDNNGQLLNLPIGSTVVKGQFVGRVFNTTDASGGTSGDCHLHFAIYDQDMPLNGAVAPVGYLYDDKGFTTSGGTLVSPNTLRYFYDPLLYVNDRNVQQTTVFPGAGSWGTTFSNTQSITARTMYMARGADIRSMPLAVSAGWVSQQVQHYVASTGTWEYLPLAPMDSYTFLASNGYGFTIFGTGATFHSFIPGNKYLDARWRGDMAEFTTVNAWLGFGRALRETYGNNPNWDPSYGLAMMGYEFNGPSTYAIVQVAYLKSDPLTRFVCYLNQQTGIWSSWVQVH